MLRSVSFNFEHETFWRNSLRELRSTLPSMFDDRVESIVLRHPHGPRKVRLVAREPKLFEHNSLFPQRTKVLEPNADHPFGFLSKTCPKRLAGRRRHITRPNSPGSQIFSANNQALRLSSQTVKMLLDCWCHWRKALVAPRLSLQNCRLSTGQTDRNSDMAQPQPSSFSSSAAHLNTFSSVATTIGVVMGWDAVASFPATHGRDVKLRLGCSGE